MKPLKPLSRLPLVQLLVLSFALAAAMPALARNDTPASTSTLLNVSASAEAKRVPDIATLSAGVLAQAADGNAAMRQNAERMNKVLAAVRAAGIAERDVQTSGISLNPRYEYADNQAPKIVGYEARNTVNLKVRDITRLGKVLDALAASGTDNLYGPNFGIDDPEPLYDEARLAALGKARARAETYAKALDLRVLRIVSINEGGGNGVIPVPMVRAMAAKAEMDSTPVAAGETTVSVNLNVVFELGK